MKIEMDKDFRGNAYIIQNEDVLLKFSGGFADLANEIPNTLNTRLATASMGKTFVAVGILQLIEAGKLKFEDTLGDILDINLKSIDPGVTVEDIVKFWKGLIGHKLLSEKMVSAMFSKQSGDGKDPEEGYYGYGVWIIDNLDGQDYVYMQGIDDGVSAISEYNPNNGMITVMLSNYGDNVWSRMRKVRKEMY